MHPQSSQISTRFLWNHNCKFIPPKVICVFWCYAKPFLGLTKTFLQLIQARCAWRNSEPIAMCRCLLGLHWEQQDLFTPRSFLSVDRQLVIFLLVSPGDSLSLLYVSDLGWCVTSCRGENTLAPPHINGKLESKLKNVFENRQSIWWMSLPHSHTLSTSPWV